MAKGRNTRALAALGLGAAVLSGMMGKKKGEDKKDMGSEDIGKDRLGAAGLDRGDKDTTGDMSAGMSKDKLADLERVKAPTRKKPAASTPKAPTRAASPATSAFSVPTPANRAESARLARLGGKDNSMYDELQGLGRLREDRGDMTETGSERLARKQEAAAGKMRSAWGFKKGGAVKKSTSKVSSASKRADGCAVKGKTRGKMV